MVRRPPQILITTPESLYLILTSRARSILSTVRYVIVDEIHALSGNKRGAHLSLSLERMEHLVGHPFASGSFLFSHFDGWKTAPDKTLRLLPNQKCAD